MIGHVYEHQICARDLEGPAVGEFIGESPKILKPVYLQESEHRNDQL